MYEIRKKNSLSVFTITAHDEVTLYNVFGCSYRVGLFICMYVCIFTLIIALFNLVYCDLG